MHAVRAGTPRDHVTSPRRRGSATRGKIRLHRSDLSAFNVRTVRAPGASIAMASPSRSRAHLPRSRSPRLRGPETPLPLYARPRRRMRRGAQLRHVEAADAMFGSSRLRPGASPTGAFGCRAALAGSARRYKPASGAGLTMLGLCAPSGCDDTPSALRARRRAAGRSLSPVAVSRGHHRQHTVHSWFILEGTRDGHGNPDEFHGRER